MTEMNLSQGDADPPQTTFAGNLDSSPDVSEGFARSVGREVLRRVSAMLGLAWIILLVLCAVFSPFICNSHPLLLKESGRWSSPLLAHLTPADVILQIAFWSAVLLYLFPGSWARRRVSVWAVLLAISIVVCPFIIHPPELVVYETYRVDQAAGRMQRAFYVPIPFSPDDHLRDQDDVRLTAPSKRHLAGTTSDSADLLSNLIYASRIAVSIGFISTGIAASIGIVLGALMGYYGGLIDLLGMRFAEIFDSIPTLLLLLIFVAVAKNVNLYLMMAIIGFTSWVGYAYFVRAEFLSLRDRDFVLAARAAGLPLRRILFRHMLPNGITPLIVNASFGVASAILAESTLSFLGIGLVNEASWGNLLEQALGEGGTFYWWIALYPGLAIFLTVFSYNLIGEALRDALDPKIRKQE
jgi:peptide/nickel transport system permease protein